MRSCIERLLIVCKHTKPYSHGGRKSIGRYVGTSRGVYVGMEDTSNDRVSKL